MKTSLPFNRPMVSEVGFAYLRQAVDNMHLSGDGPFTRRCHERLSPMVGGGKVLLTTSCTHALEMAALLLNVGPGDEVIVPSFTFVSTVNAFVLRGATPVFADVRSDTFNLDERLLQKLITPRTRVIVPVHYAGVACEMDAILRIANAAGVAVVEDNAHGLCGAYRGRPLGSFGVLATQSFHETKNFSCGEGGALVLNDPTMFDPAEIIREKGTNRSRFFRGQVDKYTWVGLGSSYLPSDALAALLLAQLEDAEAIQNRRRILWQKYRTSLGDWAADRGVTLPFVPGHCDSPHHLFAMLAPNLNARQAMLADLKAAGVTATFHYVPLHLSEMGQRYGGRPRQCPVSESISDRLIRLPLFYGLTDEEQETVIRAVQNTSLTSVRKAA